MFISLARKYDRDDSGMSQVGLTQVFVKFGFSIV